MLRNVAWSGEHEKEQKNDRKLFRQAGQAEIKASTWLKLSRSVSNWSDEQQTGPSPNSGPQTSRSKRRVSSSSGYLRIRTLFRRNGKKCTSTGGPSYGHGKGLPKNPFFPHEPRMTHFPSPLLLIILCDGRLPCKTNLK